MKAFKQKLKKRSDFSLKQSSIVSDWIPYTALFSELSCKVTVYCFQVCFLTADWLAVTVCLDRYNAVMRPVWYKENCSQKRAFILIVPVLAAILIAAVPKAMWQQLSEQDGCRDSKVLYSQILTAFGLVPIVLVVVLTLRTLFAIRSQNVLSRAADAEIQRQVLTA